MRCAQSATALIISVAVAVAAMALPTSADKICFFSCVPPHPPTCSSQVSSTSCFSAVQVITTLGIQGFFPANASCDDSGCASGSFATANGTHHPGYNLCFRDDVYGAGQLCYRYGRCGCKRLYLYMNAARRGHRFNTSCTQHPIPNALYLYFHATFSFGQAPHASSKATTTRGEKIAALVIVILLGAASLGAALYMRRRRQRASITTTTVTKSQANKLYAAVAEAEADDDEDLLLLAEGGGLDDGDCDAIVADFQVGQNRDFSRNAPIDVDFDD
eukprot:m.57527 g.57527  ORF g.57527 m.57527 type:complete len:274 (+) comp7768_c0_seq1:249-1070(+)